MPNFSAKAAFFAKAGALTLAIAALVGWMEHGLRGMTTTHAVKRVALARGDATILALGPSQGIFGLSIVAMGVRGVNLANVGQDLPTDLGMLRLALGSQPSLRRVFWVVGYPSLGYRLQNSPEAWRLYLYHARWGIPNPLPGAWMDARNYSLLAIYEPLPALKLALKGFPGEQEALELDAAGFQGTPVLDEELATFKLSDIAAAKRVKYLHTTMDPSLEEPNAAVLAEGLRLCAARGIACAIVHTPVHPAFARAADPARLARMRGLCLEAARAAGAVVLDHYADPAYHDADFFDVDHLNREGAARFSQALARELPGPH